MSFKNLFRKTARPSKFDPRDRIGAVPTLSVNRSIVPESYLVSFKVWDSHLYNNQVLIKDKK